MRKWLLAGLAVATLGAGFIWSTSIPVKAAPSDRYTLQVSAVTPGDEPGITVTQQPPGTACAGGTRATPFSCTQQDPINVILTAPVSVTHEDGRREIAYNTWTGCDAKNDSLRTCTVAVGPSADGSATKGVTVIYGSAPQPPASAPIDYKALRHAHIRAFDDVGKDITSGQFDGQGGEVRLYLVENDKIIYRLCSTHPGKTQDNISEFYFQPSFGSKENLKKPIPINDYKQLGEPSNDPNQNCRDTALESGGGSQWPDPNYHYKNFQAGRNYQVVAFGIGGDSPWNPVDGNSQFYELMDISIAVDGKSYTYSGRSAVIKDKTDACPLKLNDEKTACEPGETYVRTYALSGTNPDLPNQPCGRGHNAPCVPHDVARDDFVFNVFSTSGGGLFNLLQRVIGWVIQKMLQAAAALNGVVGNFTTIPHSHFTNSADSGVLQAWNVARSFANTLFVLVLIVVAIMNIIRYQPEKYDLRTALPRLLIAVVLVNFSLVIVGALVDLANVASLAAQHACKTPEKLCDFVAEDSASGTLVVFGVAFLSGGPIFLIAVLAFIYLLLMLFLALMMAFRFVAIIAMAALAPIAFMLYALPATESLMKKWWSNLVRMLVVGPVVSFLLLIGYLFLRRINDNGVLNLFLGIGALIIAAMSPMLVGPKVFSSVGNPLKKALTNFGKRRIQSSKGYGRIAERARKGQLIPNIPGLRALNKPLAPFVRPLTKPLGTAMTKGSAGVYAQRLKDAEGLVAVENIGERKAGVADRDAALATARFIKLADSGFLSEKDAQAYYKQHGKSPYLSQVMESHFKNLKKAPSTANALKDHWAVIGKGAPMPGNIGEDPTKSGAENYAARMSVGAILEDMNLDELDYVPGTASATPQRANVRRQLQMNTRAFKGAFKTKKAAIVGVGVADYDSFANEVRSRRLDRWDTDRIRTHMETTFRTAGSTTKTGFDTYGDDQIRNEIIEGIA